MASNSFIPIYRNENGKRERMDQEDDPDVLPLSKRMNNIHFDGGVHGMEAMSHSSSQAHGSHSHNGVPNGYIHNHLINHSQPSSSSAGIGNGVIRGNENHLHNYSNGIGDGQAQGGFGHTANGMNGYIENPVGVRVHAANGNFEERQIYDASGPPPLNKIEYSPTLDQETNPFYYEQNRILFELYKERLERHNLPAHPNYGPH